MSYEGHVQCLCPKGHYFEGPDHVQWMSEEDDKCDECGEKYVWQNCVDDTNCDSYGEIDMKQFLVKPAEYKTCDLGHRHEVSPEVYRIPTPEETKKARCYRPDYGGTPLVPLHP